MKPIAAAFTDFRLVKGRKICQLVLEIPIEAADEALGTLGGVPRPDVSRWIALAPLNVRSQHPPKARDDAASAAPDRAGADEGPASSAPAHQQPSYKEPFADRPKRPLSLSQRCALTCGEISFRRFMEQRFSSPPMTGEHVAQAVRDICGVKSRTDLNTDAEAAERWRSLELDYENWQRAA